MMGSVLHILPVHLHHPVSRSEPGQVRGGAGLHFADKLPTSVPLTVQVKAITKFSLNQKAESGSQLDLHREGESGSKCLGGINR